jgi:hypothetical protein
MKLECKNLKINGEYCIDICTLNFNPSYLNTDSLDGKDENLIVNTIQYTITTKEKIPFFEKFNEIEIEFEIFNEKCNCTGIQKNETLIIGTGILKGFI